VKNAAGLPENFATDRVYLIRGELLSRLMALAGGVQSDDGSLDVEYGADHLNLRVARGNPMLASQYHPWKVTVKGSGASATYSCTNGRDETSPASPAGRVWTREGKKLEVAAVPDSAISATSTVVCEVTIPDGAGTPSAEIKLLTGAVDYWAHGSGADVIVNYPLALITVTDGVPSVEQLRFSDIDAGAGANVNDDATSDLKDSAGTDFVVLTADGATNTRDAKPRALTAQVDHGRLIRWSWGTPAAAGIYVPPTDGQGGWRTFCVHATTDSWDEVLDSSIDWRNRIVQSWIATHGTAAADPAADSRYTGRTGSAENLVSDGAYQLYVASDGKLRCSAATATVAGRLIHVLVSGAQCAPYTCPCGTWPPSAWPCQGLVEEYEITFDMRVRSYSTADCSGSPDCDDTEEISVVVSAESSACVWFGTAISAACEANPGGMYLGLGTNGNWTITAALFNAAAPQTYAIDKQAGLTPVGNYTGMSLTCFEFPYFLTEPYTRYLVIDVTNVVVTEVAP